ncbi:50S ribosomal protein L25 [bacterium]|nr:MAG: 50S ribosomal protein L25 [bacterium]
MEKITLKANTREVIGKEAGNRLRKAGIIPAVVYKRAEKAIPLAVNERNLFSTLHTSAGENVIIALEIFSQEKSEKPDMEKTVIIKEVQYHPIKRKILHIDFQEIALTEKITVEIPIETKGEPVGVKSDGGILDHPIKELNIECLPTDIPEKIYVNVENLKIGDAIRVKDLDIPSNITVLDDPEQAVVSVVPPEAEELVSEEEALTEAAAEPEVIKQKKPEETPEAEQKK